MLWLVLIDLRHTDYRYADDAFDKIFKLQNKKKKKEKKIHGYVSFSFYAYMHLTMENLICENKINLFQSVYYGLIVGVHCMT